MSATRSKMQLAYRFPFSRGTALGLALVLLLVGTVPSSAAFLSFIEVYRDGVNGIDGLASAVSATVSPDGAHVYVAGYADDAVAVFGRDDTTGRLVFVQVLRDGVDGVDGLHRATSVAVSPEGAHVYVAGYLDDAIAVFQRDGMTGELTFVEALKDGVGGVEGLRSANSVTVSSDGAHVYVAGQNDFKVVVFSRDVTTGRLTYVERHQVYCPISVTVSPDGAHIYVGAGHGRVVRVYSRDGATGSLTYVEQHAHTWVSSVAVSPDGNHVFVTSRDDDTLAVYSRNGTTGALTLVETQIDGIGGVDGIDDPFDVTVSPDGGYVYVAGRLDDAVTVFSRDATTGELTFVETHKEGAGGIDGLKVTQSVTVSPDGHHVYATGSADDAVVVFSTAAPPPVPVTVDIKPQSCPNPLNVKKKGVLPVAILGTEDLDVTQIDPALVRLEGVAPLRWGLKDVATPYEPFIGKEGAYDCVEGGPDGHLDLTFKFDAQEIIAALGKVDDGDILALQLTGNLKEESGGTPIAGEDAVWILKR